MRPELLEWENFYVIVGSSAGALTGLQFVVMALVAETKGRSTSDLIGAFGTPTIVHFCTVLMLSAVLSAPWHSLTAPGVLLGASGAVGIGYVVLIMIRTRRQDEYKPVFEDWLWHAAVPFVSYSLLLVGATALPRGSTWGLFMIATTSLLLLFVGIHNAWDTVTYIVSERVEKRNAEPAADS